MRGQKINGIIKKKWKNCFLIKIYSKPLVEKVRDINQKVSISNFKNGLIIKPKEFLHATIIQNKGLQIAITKLLNKNKINIDTSRKIIPVFVPLKEWGLTSLISKARGMPNIGESVPKDLISIPAGIIEKQNKFVLDVSLKTLHNIVRKDVVRCLIARKRNLFILVRSYEPNARKLLGHSGHRVQISIPKSFLTNKEISQLKKKNWIQTNVKLNLKSFGLVMTDFFREREEKELIKTLINKGIEVFPKDVRAPFDILLKTKKVAIEIHNSKPQKDDLARRHSVRTGQAMLRIFEAFHNLKRLNFKHTFVIVKNLWKRNKHIMELVDYMKNKNVHVIFTDFEGSWANSVVTEIQKIIGD